MMRTQPGALAVIEPVAPPRTPGSTRNDLARADARITGSPLIGRAAERAALNDALDEAERGRGRVIALIGEAGIGKTHLAQHVAERARARGFIVLWGRSHDTAGAPPYRPWIQVLRACEHSADGPAGVAGTAADALERGWGAPETMGADALGVDAERFRLFDAVAGAFTAAARHRPLLIVLEDLHWADRSTLLLLQFVGRELGNARVLVIGSCRDDELPPRHPLFESLGDLLREPSFERMALHGLAHDEVYAQLAAIAGRNPPRAFVRAIAQRSDGNPFCVQEILRCLVEDGAVYFDGARWTSALHPDHMPMPASIRAAIDRRLTHLSGDGRTILCAAAVIGREFTLDTLQALAELPPGRVRAGLDELLEMRVLVRMTGRMHAYRFPHALFRETLYALLPDDMRTQLHRRAATVLQQRYGAAAEEHAAELAYHFEHGNDPPRALRYALRAAEQASAQRAHEAAAAHYAAALRALAAAAPDDDARRVELYLARSSALWRSGELTAARDAAQQALALAREHSWAPALARAALAFAGRLAGFGAIVCDAQVVGVLEEALGALGEGNTALHALVMARLAEELTFVGERQRAQGLAREAIDLARRLGDRAVIAPVLQSLHWALWAPEGVEQRLAVAEEILPAAEPASERAIALDGYVFRCFARLELGDMMAARQEFASCTRLAAELRQPDARWLIETMRVCLAFGEGRLDAVEPLLQTCFEAGQAAENPNVTFFYAVQRAHLAWLRGRFDEVHSLADGLAQAYPPLELAVRCGRALTLTEEGRHTEAREIFETIAQRGFAAIPRNVTWLTTVSFLAETCAALADAARAAALYDLLRPFAGRNVILAPMLALGAADHYLGLLAATFGRWDHAARHFRDAVALNARIGTRQWLARTQLAYAELLDTHGTAEPAAQARQLAQEAEATANALALPTLAARARARGVRPVPTGLKLDGASIGAASVEAHQPSVFRREGEYWTIAYRGTVVRLKDCKGLRYLAHLLREAGRKIHVLDLVAAASGNGSATLVQEGVGPALDERGRAEVRAKRRDLCTELGEAEEWNDSGRVARLRAQIEAIDEYMRAAHGLGGRSRPERLPAEQARQAVAKGVAVVRRRIARDHPALGCHLDVHVKTGFLCVYQPEDEGGNEWILD